MQYIHPSCYIVAMCHIYTANLYYSMKIRLQTSGYIEYNYSERYWFHDSIMSKTQNIKGSLSKTTCTGGNSATLCSSFAPGYIYYKWDLM